MTDRFVVLDRCAVLAARERLRDLVRRTPVLDATVDGPAGPVPVTFKLEQTQIGGSFKVRGSLNALLAATDRPGEVVIASGGNAAIGATHAAAMVGVRCIVVVPATAPAAKVALLRELGAQVIAHGDAYPEAYSHATDLARARDALQLHAYDLPDVVAGAGVIGLEIEEQAPGADPVLVAVGGGGLVAGIAAALPDRQVIGVEPVGIPTLNRALRAGEPVDVEIDSIAADALGARRLGDIAFDVARRTGIGSVLVSDDDIVTSRRFLWREFRIVVEWAGATALAAIRSGTFVPESGQRAAVVVCGANTDPASL